MNWHLQDAKNNFSKLVREAIKNGPQTVTLRGAPTAVVLSVEDYERIRETKPTLAEFILSGPAWDDDIVEMINQRSKTPSRPTIEF
jgi:prevent-host-death family protein